MTSNDGRPTKSDSFFANEIFDWQYPVDLEGSWDIGWVYNKESYWGRFPAETASEDWPVLAPSPGSWDRGRFGGGVHNGSIIRRDGMFSYVYRGHRPCPAIAGIDYICKIGLATSKDGKRFEKLTADVPLFGKDDSLSYEDVSLVHHGGSYYLFCNRWDWERRDDPRVSGCWLAESEDLLHWKEHGIVFPNADAIHRNGVILQNPRNEPVRVHGSFAMYLNKFIVAYSDDLIHWESRQIEDRWPGGEGCFALADYSDDPDAIVLFTGGHHSGHFYAIGEVLFSKGSPERPMEWLPRPILHAEAAYPHESGYSATDPSKRISPYRDCIFFNGLTQHGGNWWLYYGGSEYYTCLATAPVGLAAVAPLAP